MIDSLKNEETLVLCNHQSTSDVPLLMHCFGSRRELLEKLNWVMDAVFQYTNFGIVSTLHGDFFINAVSACNYDRAFYKFRRCLKLLSIIGSE